MKVEIVRTALTQYKRTWIARIPATGAMSIEGNPANTTELIILSLPMPGGHAVPVFDVDLHCGWKRRADKGSCNGEN